MVRTEIRPIAGFEEDYARYVDRRARVEAEVKAEYEKVLLERTEKIDKLIALTSEVVEIEIPDEVMPEESVSTDEYVGE